MSNRTWSVITIVASLLVGACTFFATKSHYKAQMEGLTSKVDTLLITEVKEVIKPIYVSKRVILRDTIKIRVVDSLVIERNDTTYLALAREEKVYEDSSYRAVVSGIEPRLDSLRIYESTRYVTITEKAKQSHWGIGLSAGVATIWSFSTKKADTGAGLMLGVQYRF